MNIKLLFILFDFLLIGICISLALWGKITGDDWVERNIGGWGGGGGGGGGGGDGELFFNELSTHHNTIKGLKRKINVYKSQNKLKSCNKKIKANHFYQK